ncbi:MAG: phenylalanine--tRNA ligase subunit beta, partial [Parcubacteria group bacterium]|nr:phenylalanine--tRNA ligase subunit beta [Parcubacteria group bacterium]
DKKLCPRYMGIVLNNIEIGESPKWMQSRLNAAGMRPINNIVDITNYVMLEYGQPLHVFDFNKIQNIAFANNNSKVDQNKLKRIIVRKAKNNESIVTIDNKKRNLDESMLVIADEKEPIAIAGVMGGLNSEVNENSKTILLEAANFNGTSIRKTSQKLGLRSEAVLRFEKGQSVDLPEYALYRAVELFEKYAGAMVSSEIADTLKTKPKSIKIKLSLDYVERLIGIKISKEKIIKILNSLEFGVVQSKDYLNIEVPIYRTDIKAEEDLVEEIARVYGYDNIEPQEISGKLEPVDEIPDLFWGRKISEYLEGAGFSESYNYSFYGEKLLKKCLLSTKDHLIVSNAGSQDLKYLRTTLLPRLLENAETNFRNYDEFKLFEIGHVYFTGGIECKSLSGIVVGDSDGVFYKAKGTLEFLLQKLNIDHVIHEFKKTEGCEYWNMYEKGQSIRFKGAGQDGDYHLLGTISMCDSRVLNSFNLKNKKLAFFNFSLDQLSQKASLNKQFKPLPKYPSITLDLAFVLEKNIPAKKVAGLIKETGGELLKDLELFDVYKGKGLEDNQKSLAFHLVYRSDDKTLKDEEAELVQKKIIGKLESELGAKVRG